MTQPETGKRNRSLPRACCSAAAVAFGFASCRSYSVLLSHGHRPRKTLTRAGPPTPGPGAGRTVVVEFMASCPPRLAVRADAAIMELHPGTLYEAITAHATCRPRTRARPCRASRHRAARTS